MKYKGMKLIHPGQYINRYDIEYEAESGALKTYEIISRNPELRSLEDLQGSRPDAVVMILHNITGEKILLNREFRMAVGGWVYNFPAGLIDSGEDTAASAARELREETGLQLLEITEIWRESYSAVGFSNEKTIVVIGTADGEIRPSDSEMEEIEAGWFTREETAALLKTEAFAARTQAYCAMWCRG